MLPFLPSCIWNHHFTKHIIAVLPTQGTLQLKCMHSFHTLALKPVNIFHTKSHTIQIAGTETHLSLMTTGNVQQAFASSSHCNSRNLQKPWLTTGHNAPVEETQLCLSTAQSRRIMMHVKLDSGRSLIILEIFND